MTTDFLPSITDYINSFLTSTTNVFDTMAGCTLTRGKPFIGGGPMADYEISGIVGISGDATLTVVLSLDEHTARRTTSALLGELPEKLDADVADTVGELVNMVAGNAKSLLKGCSLTLGLPSVVSSPRHKISFPRDAKVIAIPFTCDWGKVCVSVGLLGAASEPVTPSESGAVTSVT